MPWEWNAPKEGTELGGVIGTMAEAKQTGAWPDYEAEHLAKVLTHQSGKLAHGMFLRPDEKSIFLDKVTDSYKDEAERCLKSEFNLWLQGLHPDNEMRTGYVQGGGKPVRRKVYGSNTRYDDNEWAPTWWGKRQLTNLPGVREYLKEMAVHSDKAEFDMNVLAEHGPQDLQTAWAYFKHWVKGRPISDTCELFGVPKEAERSDIGTELPRGMPHGTDADRAPRATTSAAGSVPYAIGKNMSTATSGQLSHLMTSPDHIFPGLSKTKLGAYLNTHPSTFAHIKTEPTTPAHIRRTRARMAETETADGDIFYEAEEPDDIGAMAVDVFNTARGALATARDASTAVAGGVRRVVDTAVDVAAGPRAPVEPPFGDTRDTGPITDAEFRANYSPFAATPTPAYLEDEDE